MRRRMVCGIMLALVAVLVLVAPAFAGGWAVVTLDTLPREVRAGQTLHLGFMVRQHGQTPISSVSPTLTAMKQDATTVRAEARQEGPVGHFVVDVTFPSAGTWEWKIAPEPFGPTALAPLTVLPAAATGAQPAPVVQPAPAAATIRIEPATLRLAGVLLLVAAALAALSSLRSGSRKPAAEA
ncbi:MAG: hypothetical protein ACJ8CR_25605 [Roseiflexaceae bacterium]